MSIIAPFGISLMNRDWDTFSTTKDSLANNNAYQEWCSLWGKEVLRVIKPGGYLLSFCSTRMYHRMVVGLEEAGWQIRDTLSWNYASGFPKSRHLEDGQGNNLKPAMELICLARKSISESTLEKNIAKWGTGGLNIDACRIGGTEGRWPANTLFDESSVNALDQQADASVSPFFYCSKVSLKERNLGCDDLPPQKQNSKGNIRTYNDRCAVCGKKFIGAPRQRCQCPAGMKKTDKSIYQNANHHPAVKPLDLMTYLVTLVAPKNGTVLDPFLGSGSTGMATVQLPGLTFVGIEKEKEYYNIAKARIASVTKKNRINGKKKNTA